MTEVGVALDPLVARRGVSRAQYEALVEAGLLEGQPVELLEGVLAEVVPQGDAHSRALRALTRWLVPRLPEPWLVSVQMPLAVTDDSEPEPDLAVVLEPPSGHPTTAALVVEAAHSSHRTDLRHKPRLYAAAGVEQYWVVDLLTAEVVVHTEPGPGGYGSVRRLPWAGAPLAVLGVGVDLGALIGPGPRPAPHRG